MLISSALVACLLTTVFLAAWVAGRCAGPVCSGKGGKPVTSLPHWLLYSYRCLVVPSYHGEAGAVLSSHDKIFHVGGQARVDTCHVDPLFFFQLCNDYDMTMKG